MIVKPHDTEPPASWSDYQPAGSHRVSYNPAKLHDSEPAASWSDYNPAGSHRVSHKPAKLHDSDSESATSLIAASYKPNDSEPA